VGKGEIIALDENDVMALVTRHLVENVRHFDETRIRFSQGESLPMDAEELTAIGNLYDILKVLFSKLGSAKKAAELRFIRPSDDELQAYKNLAGKFFDGLAKRFGPLQGYFAASAASAPKIIQKQRRADGGHVLFRPVGLRLFAEVAVDLVSKGGVTLEEALSLMAKLPVELSKSPYRGVIWLSNGKMNPSGRAMCKRLLLYMLGYEKNTSDLRGRYARVLGGDSASVKLPTPVK